MDELRSSENTVYDAVDYALRTYPLKHAPINLLSEVMERIQRRRSMPGFLPTWIDMTISIFITAMLAYLGWLWSLFTYSSNWIARMEFQILVWWQELRYWFLLRPWLVFYGLVLLMGIVLSMMLLKAAWLTLPARVETVFPFGISSRENPSE